jgi:hypothetical protein
MRSGPYDPNFQNMLAPGAIALIAFGALVLAAIVALFIWLA